MSKTELELQEDLRRLAIKIVKCYKGKGPDNVNVKINGNIIIIEVRGILSKLSDILVKQGARQVVMDYWKYIKPHLEKEFLQEACDILGGGFDYSWEVKNLELEDKERVVVIKVNKH
ncbi:MAG: Na-translocating system protein MpsC family protein [Clostridium perfringens]|nr:Na-translocating system protein MpsC family protein [Clostridium perfringens]